MTNTLPGRNRFAIDCATGSRRREPRAVLPSTIEKEKCMSVRRTQVIQTIAILCVACSTLAACVPVAHPTRTRDTLDGTWVNGETVLVLNADATFTLVGAPVYTAVGEGEKWPNGADPTRDESGDWGVEPDAVRLIGEKLYFNHSGSELVLEWGLDLGSDDPRCYQLVREASSLIPLGPEDCHIRA